jgi:hypothetical protein
VRPPAGATGAASTPALRGPAEPPNWTQAEYEFANLAVPCSDLLARLSMYVLGVEAFMAHMSEQADLEPDPEVRDATHGVLIALREYAEASGYVAPPEEVRP